MDAILSPIASDLVPGLLSRLPYFVLCRIKSRYVIRELLVRIRSDVNEIVPIRCDPSSRYLHGKTARAEQLCRMWDGWIEFIGTRQGLSQIKHRFLLQGDQTLEMSDTLFVRMLSSMVLRCGARFYGTWAQVSVSGSQGLAPIEGYVMSAKKGPKRTQCPLYQ